MAAHIYTGTMATWALGNATFCCHYNDKQHDGLQAHCLLAAKKNTQLNGTMDDWLYEYGIEKLRSIFFGWFFLCGFVIDRVLRYKLISVAYESTSPCRRLSSHSPWQLHSLSVPIREKTHSSSRCFFLRGRKCDLCKKSQNHFNRIAIFWRSHRDVMNVNRIHRLNWI